MVIERREMISISLGYEYGESREQRHCMHGLIDVKRGTQQNLDISNEVNAGKHD